MKGNLMSDPKENPKSSNSGWRFWLYIFVIILITKLFGLVGAVIFGALFGLVEYLMKKGDHPSHVTNRAPASRNTPIKNSAPVSMNSNVIDEDILYETVANEIETGNINKGLWTRLLVEMDGDEKKTKIAYIKYRLDQLSGSYSPQTSPKIKSMSTNVSPEDASRQFFANIRLNKTEVAAQLLMQFPSLISMVEDDGKTALHVALIMGNKEMTKFLVTNGADVCVADQQGRTPVELAKRSGDQYLLSLVSSRALKS